MRAPPKMAFANGSSSRRGLISGRPIWSLRHRGTGNGGPEFVTAWEAEAQAIASKEAGTLEDVEARLRVLESERVQLIKLRTELKQAAREAVRPARGTVTIRSRSKALPKGRRGRHPVK
jgi:hypothetical protein